MLAFFLCWNLEPHLRPGNIIALFQEFPQGRVIDFGIVSAVEWDGWEEVQVLDFGELVLNSGCEGVVLAAFADEGDFFTVLDEGAGADAAAEAGGALDAEGMDRGCVRAVDDGGTSSDQPEASLRIEPASVAGAVPDLLTDVKLGFDVALRIEIAFEHVLASHDDFTDAAWS